MNTTVIVGASVAGVRTAQSLRSRGYSGRVVLISGESRLPYDKPPLSKGFLTGAVAHADIGLLALEQASADDIELWLGRRGCGVDLADGHVELDDGSRVGFDQLVVATGARPGALPWRTPKGVHVLRTISDAEALRADLDRGGPVVVVGAGVIGVEVAAAARQRGHEVTVVDPLPGPMHRVVGAGVGKRVAAMHRAQGVRMLFDVGVQGIDGTRGGLRVLLDDGRTLDAGTVVVGIGVEVADQWLAGSGLRLDDGVLCDQYCRSVSAPHVFAAGDVARWFHAGLGRTVRAEHWTNAVNQAACVAHNIVNPTDLQAYTAVPYVWSDQFGWRLCVVGEPTSEPQQIVEGVSGPDGAQFAALYCGADQILTGAVVVNWPRALMHCRLAIERRLTIDDALDQVTAEMDRAADQRRTPTAAR